MQITYDRWKRFMKITLYFPTVVRHSLNTVEGEESGAGKKECKMNNANIQWRVEFKEVGKIGWAHMPSDCMKIKTVQGAKRLARTYLRHPARTLLFTSRISEVRIIKIQTTETVELGAI